MIFLSQDLQFLACHQWRKLKEVEKLSSTKIANIYVIKPLPGLLKTMENHWLGMWERGEFISQVPKALTRCRTNLSHNICENSMQSRKLRTKRGNFFESLTLPFSLELILVIRPGKKLQTINKFS